MSAQTLKATDWHKLTRNHRNALNILADATDAEIEPEAPRSMINAMHDLWRFGMAERSWPEGARGTCYKITMLGRRAHAELVKS